MEEIEFIVYDASSNFLYPEKVQESSLKKELDLHKYELEYNKS